MKIIMWSFVGLQWTFFCIQQLPNVKTYYRIQLEMAAYDDLLARNFGYKMNMCLLIFLVKLCIWMNIFVLRGDICNAFRRINRIQFCRHLWVRPPLGALEVGIKGSFPSLCIEKNFDLITESCKSHCHALPGI